MSVKIKGGSSFSQGSVLNHKTANLCYWRYPLWSLKEGLGAGAPIPSPIVKGY